MRWKSARVAGCWLTTGEAGLLDMAVGSLEGWLRTSASADF
jgi:hypothetical protein